MTILKKTQQDTNCLEAARGMADMEFHSDVPDSLSVYVWTTHCAMPQ